MLSCSWGSQVLAVPCSHAWDSADLHDGLRREDLWGDSAEAVPVSQLVELSKSRLPWVPSDSTGLSQPLMLRTVPQDSSCSCGQRNSVPGFE